MALVCKHGFWECLWQHALFLFHVLQVGGTWLKMKQAAVTSTGPTTWQGKENVKAVSPHAESESTCRIFSPSKTRSKGSAHLPFDLLKNTKTKRHTVEIKGHPITKMATWVNLQFLPKGMCGLKRWRGTQGRKSLRVSPSALVSRSGPPCLLALRLYLFCVDCGLLWLRFSFWVAFL